MYNNIKLYMSDLLNIKNYYYFLAGVVVGKTSGIISTVVISSVLLFVVNPLVLTHVNMTNTKEFIINVITNITKRA